MDAKTPPPKKKRKMPVNNTGQWGGARDQNKFTYETIIYEGLNNLAHAATMVVKIVMEPIRIMEKEYMGYSFTETGGLGFEDALTFEEATTWGSSDNKGLNNFGTGYKCECMLPDEPVYKVIKTDTSLPDGVVWSSDGECDIPDHEDLLTPFIREKMMVSEIGERQTRAIWGEGADMVSDELLIENISNISANSAVEVDDRGEDDETPGERIHDAMSRRYGRCLSDISFNGTKIKNDGFFEESSAKDHVSLDGKKIFDIMNIESYQKDGKWAIKCSPEREFHEKPAPFWITDKMKTFKKQKGPPKWIPEEPIATITMQIMEHQKKPGGSKMFPLVKYNVHCEMSGEEGKEGIIFSEEKWTSDWGTNIHLLLKGEGEWTDPLPNKSRSRVKEILMDSITMMVNGYYLKPTKQHGAVFAKPLEPDKTRIPDKTKDDEVQSLKEWQAEQDYFVQRMEEGFFNCMCCHGLIQRPASKKMNQCDMGHIKSEAVARKEGEEDDVSQGNLVPICSHCNSNMGTSHMTDYIQEKFGKKSENFKQYKEYCLTKGKIWKPTNIDERDWTFC